MLRPENLGVSNAGKGNTPVGDEYVKSLNMFCQRKPIRDERLGDTIRPAVTVSLLGTRCPLLAGSASNLVGLC